jgi:hypothetical protein
LGGIEDHAGTNNFEGTGDFNALIFSLMGNISVVAASADQTAFNAGVDSNGVVVTFMPTGIFALYSTNGVGEFYSSVASANVNESTTQQHFALLDGVIPEPGTGGLAGAVLAADFVGKILRSRIRRTPAP